MEKRWWKEEVVYQIYPRSYKDNDNNGYGDIQGIISKLDYIKSLGANVIWLSPVYKSPDDDNGYDISDYYDINPKLGTLDDMKQLFAEAKARDMKVIMDLVINHTSDEHPWFIEAKNNPESKYRDYYYFRKGRKNGKKAPNNWSGYFSGPAWEKIEGTDDYYLHLFSRKQPDLNYHNPEVLKEVKNICKFWLDLGCSGFRCDVINIIYKDSLENGKPRIFLTGKEHYVSKPGCHRILKEIRHDVWDNYDCFTVGESSEATMDMAKDLTNDELHLLFCFEHLNIDIFVAPVFRTKFKPWKLNKCLTKWQTRFPWNTCFFECHDQVRVVSRYGDDKHYHKESAKAIATLQFGLKGTCFIYEGQEIGMTNVKWNSIDEFDDVSTHYVNTLLTKLHIPSKLKWKLLNNFSRDHARTPMQWDDSINAGFNEGEKTWLKVNENYKNINVANNLKDKNSIWYYYQKIIALRKANEGLIYGDFKPVKSNKNLMVFERVYEDKKYLVVVNLSSKNIKHNLDIKGKVLISTYNKKTIDETLLPYEAFILEK